MEDRKKVNSGLVLLICLMFVVIIGLCTLLLLKPTETGTQSGNNTNIDGDNIQNEDNAINNSETSNNDSEEVKQDSNNEEDNVKENNNKEDSSSESKVDKNNNQQEIVKTLSASEMKALFYNKIDNIEYSSELTQDEKEKLWSNFYSEIKADNAKTTREYFDNKYNAVKSQLENSILQVKQLKDSIQSIEDARKELNSISNQLKNQSFSMFDGKTITGADVCAFAQTYNNSETMNMKIIVSKEKEYNFGKFKFSVPSATLATLKQPIEGGVVVSLQGMNTKKSTLEDVVSNVKNYDIYYSYVMKDSETQEAVGCLFVNKSAGL